MLILSKLGLALFLFLFLFSIYAPYAVIVIPHRFFMFSSKLPPPRNVEKTVTAIRIEGEKPLNVTAAVYGALVTSKTLTVPNQHSSTQSHAVDNLRLNQDGSLNYSLTVASSADPERNYQASFSDTIPLKKRFPRLKHLFPLPANDDEELQKCIENTKDAIDMMLLAKLGLTRDKNNYNARTPQDTDATVVNFSSSAVATASDDERGRPRERTMEIRSFQEDPLLPPKFKVRKNKTHETSPPPPILKKAPEKPLTKEEQDAWKIPAAISNWKNNQGFTISLDKRILAANGGSETTSELNIEGFGDLSLALDGADKKAREEIQIRNARLAELAMKEQQEKETRLRELAELSRQERAKRSFDDRRNSKRRR